jgi:hypothetical protein
MTGGGSQFVKNPLAILREEPELGRCQMSCMYTDIKGPQPIELFDRADPRTAA